MKQIKWAVLIAALGLVGYAAWIALNDPQQIYSALNQVGWLGFAALCGVSLLNYLIRYMRWCLLMRVQTQTFPVVDGFICYLSGFALSTTPGKVGESVRAVFFKERHNVAVASSLASLLTERLTDLLAALMLGSVAFIFFKNLWWVCCLISVVCVVVILAIINSHYIERLVNAITAMLPQRLAKLLLPLVNSLPDFFQKTRKILRPKVFLLAMLCASAAWFVEGLGFAWLARELTVDANVILLSSVFILSLVAGVATPGGVGSAEAAMVFFLIALGATPASALVISLVCRFATFWFAMVIGLLALGYVMRGRRFDNKILEVGNG